MINFLKLGLPLTFLLYSLKSFPQSDFSDEQVFSTFTEDDIREIESLKASSGKVLKSRDSETGLLINDYNVNRDKKRISFIVFANDDLASLTDLIGFEVNYSSLYSGDLWIEYYAQRTSANFSEITENNPLATRQDSLLLRESQDSVLSAGLGLGLRSNWIQKLLDSDRFFTSTGASLGWYAYDQSLTGINYSGPGIKLDFGVHKRASKSSHYGLRFAYHLAQVARPSEAEDESRSERSLTLSWLSVGFDLSFYF